MGTGIPSDGTCSNDSYLPTHAFLPAFLTAEGSASAGLIANGEPWRTGMDALAALHQPSPIDFKARRQPKQKPRRYGGV
jgi:hypothetical protein